MAAQSYMQRRNPLRDMATVAAGGVVTAADAETGRIARSADDKFQEVYTTPLDYDADRSGVGDSTTAFLKWRDDLVESLAGENRAKIGIIPPGKYRLTAEINFPVLDAGVPNGRRIIRGAGGRNSWIRSEALTGNVFSFDGGNILLEDFLIDASPERKAAVVDADDGNGIYMHNAVFPDAGGTFPVVDFKRINVGSQPGCGWKIWGPERFNWDNCTAYQCVLHGYHLYSTNGSIPQGISNFSTNSRAISCGGHGLFVEDGLHSTFINFQALGCGSNTYPSGIKSTNHGNIFINPDVEGKEKFGVVTTLYGIQLASRNQLIGGFFSQLTYGVWLNGAIGVVIKDPNFSNANLTTMARAIQMASCSHCEIDVRPVSLQSNVASITDSLQFEGNNISYMGIPQKYFATAKFTDKTSRLNTVAKTAGLRCLNTTTKVWLTTHGTTDVDPWYDDLGTLVYTPA